MRYVITQNELHSIHSSGDLPPISSRLTRPRGREPAIQNQPDGTLKDETPLIGAPSPVPLRASRFQHSAPVSLPLPGRGLSLALIAGAIAGVLSTLLAILIILIATGTFHAASLQIASDGWTVKTALAVLGLLTFVLGLLIGFATDFVMGLRIYPREQLISNRALVCRMCSTDISASLYPKRVYCCHCENKLRLAERRIAFVNKCLIENCW